MNTNLADDLAYVRSVAEAGDTAPSMNGRFTLWWSLLLTLTLLIHFTVASGFIPGVDLRWIGLAWAAFGIIGFIGSSG